MNSLKLTVPYSSLSKEAQDRLGKFIEKSCQDCIAPLGSKLCEACLKKNKFGNSFLLLIDSDGDDYINCFGQPLELVELLTALVLMMRMYNLNFGLDGEAIIEGKKIITIDGMPALNEKYDEFSDKIADACDQIVEMCKQVEQDVEINEKQNQVDENLLFDVDDEKFDLQQDIRLILSEDSAHIIHYDFWRREYNGHKLIVDGGYKILDMVFYFLKDDYEKYCLQDKSIVFENVLGCEFKILPNMKQKVHMDTVVKFNSSYDTFLRDKDSIINFINDAIKNQALKQFGIKDLHVGGLNINTTIAD
jgi:hypothetical protein